MRIAVLSDVHGNVGALQAVLDDVAGQSVDATVNLGDLLSGGLQPAEAADRLMAAALPTVRGNHERQVLTLPPEQMGASDRLVASTISDAHRAWMASLPLTLELAGGVLAFHGSPTDDLTYLLETVEPAGARPATEQEVTGRLGEAADWPLLLCGHTHLQRMMRLLTGALVVNPGSVGWPAYDDDQPYPHVMEAGTPHARYAVVDDRTGRWEVDFRSITYDWEHAASVAEGNARPDVARALRTGRACFAGGSATRATRPGGGASSTRPASGPVANRQLAPPASGTSLPGVVTVLEYDPIWAEHFQGLRTAYADALQAAGVPVVAIEHVGSTAVPGLAAKPVIDCDIVVDESDVARASDVLQGLGFTPMGELGIPQRYAFRAPTGLPQTNTYVVVRDSLSLRNHLAVRDVLRSDPLLCEEYARVKHEVAAVAADIDEYGRGKNATVQRILASAGLSESELASINGNVATAHDQIPI